MVYSVMNNNTSSKKKVVINDYDEAKRCEPTIHMLCLALIVNSVF